MTLITLASKRLSNFKITHKRSILSKEEAIEIEKLRIGSTSQLLSPLRPCQLQWFRIIHPQVSVAIQNIECGEEIRFPLGHDLYVVVNEYENTQIVHLRYYYCGGEFASRNGITVAANKYNDLANTILSFNLNEGNGVSSDKRKLLVGQIVQNHFRTRLVDVEYERNLPRGISILESFIDSNASRIFNDMENDMTTIFSMYDNLVDFVDYPAIAGKYVVSYYYTDAMKSDIIALTKSNVDYHPDTQMIIEAVEDRE